MANPFLTAGYDHFIVQSIEAFCKLPVKRPSFWAKLGSQTMKKIPPDRLLKVF